MRTSTCLRLACCGAIKIYFCKKVRLLSLKLSSLFWGLSLSLDFFKVGIYKSLPIGLLFKLLFRLERPSNLLLPSTLLALLPLSLKFIKLSPGEDFCFASGTILWFGLLLITTGLTCVPVLSSCSLVPPSSSSVLLSPSSLFCTFFAS